MKNPYRDLEKKLGYRFRRKEYLEMALTHPSYRYEEEGVRIDNQRLEFLGDAALGLVSASLLYRAHPSMQEGDLTRWRSRITSRKALVQVAKQVDLGSQLRLGRGEKQSGGHVRPSNMADAMEAVLGAAFLDGKLRAVEKIFTNLFVGLLEEADREPWGDNPKGALQEYCQQEWKTSPRYRIASEKGPAHERSFSVEVYLDGNVLGTGSGRNKRAAEMEAARQALKVLLKTGEA